MNVSAVNCTPLKPQFGQEKTIDDAQKVLDLSRDLSDSFTKEDGQKSKLQTAVSIAGALATTFVVGKLAGNTILKVAPKLPEKLLAFGEKLSTKVKTMKAPKFVQDIKFPTKLKTGIGKIADNAMVKDLASGLNAKKAQLSQYIKEKPADAFKNAVGAASMAVLGKQVASVDGNGDGIADIAQKNVNAYKHAIDNMGVIGEIAKALV